MRALAGLFAALLVAIGAAGAALAHAALIASEPADGALLREAPSQIVLRFDEPVTPLVLLLVDPKGDTTALSDVTSSNNALTIRVPGNIGIGTYVLSWRVISADGHPVGGSLVMSIGTISVGAQSAGEAQRSVTATSLAFWASRLVMLAGLLAGVGGVVFLKLIGPGWQAPHAVRRGIAVVLAAGATACVLSIGLQGLDAHARGITEIGDATMWRTGLATSHGAAALIALGAMAVAAMALRSPPRAAAWLGTLALACAGLAFATSGHASTAPPQMLSQPALLMHAVALVVWLGSLAPLSTALATHDARGLPALKRFSAWAPALVAVIVATGLVLAVLQMAGWNTLWTTDYGLLLLAKLALVASVLGLGGFNRWHLTPKVIAGDAEARQTMQGVIMMEIMLVATIVAIAAAWRFTPPPRALAAGPEPHFQIHMHGTGAMANVVLSPARAGPVRAVIEPRTPDLRPLEVKEVEISLLPEEPGLEPIRRAAQRGSGTSWIAEGLVIPRAGRWRVQVEMLVTDFEKARVEARIEVRR